MKSVIQSSDGILLKIERETQDQSINNSWFEMRYGRITASKVYEASKCNTTDGTLVKQILGSSKVKLSKAMKRGIHLEEQVSLIFKNVSSIL